ncbi:hypothetical protein BGZ83_006276 [Gryganskiella cystojenkinii]|nr:hypothetical protein BGZ83_006276 [Gryganskiella cystojenkinii]
MLFQGVASILPLLAFASVTFGEVTFNVIAYPEQGGALAVSVDGKITRLHTSLDTFPLWTGSVSSASSASLYKYVLLSETGEVIKSESFERPGPSRKETLNEFFDREITKARFPDIPQIGPDVRPKPSIAFDETQMATIHITTSPEAFASLIADPRRNDEEIKVDFFYVNADLTHRVESVKMKLAGKSSRGFKKLSFKFKFSTKEGQEFFDRPTVKLRAQNYDPTFIREKLYIDVLNSVGVHSQQGVWVRLFINNEPWGLYLMVDDIDKHFLRYNIHHDKDKDKSEDTELGALYQMAAPLIPLEADLQYNGTLGENYPPSVYKNEVLGNNPEGAPLTRLIEFMKTLHDFDPKNPAALEFWNRYLDLDEFLLCMAVEFLGGSWDGYWWDGSNYLMYLNPTLAGCAEGDRKGKWQWIPTDFDSTFGDGDPTAVLTPYQTYANMTQRDHPLVSKLILGNRDINARFEAILMHVVNGVFKPEALFGRVDAYEQFLAKDAEWDLTIDRSKITQGKYLWYTIKDFHTSLHASVRGIRIGIKPWIERRAREVPVQMNSGVRTNTFKRSVGPKVKDAEPPVQQVRGATLMDTMTHSANLAETLTSATVFGTTLAAMVLLTIC